MEGTEMPPQDYAVARNWGGFTYLQALLESFGVHVVCRTLHRASQVSASLKNFHDKTNVPPLFSFFTDSQRLLCLSRQHDPWDPIAASPCSHFLNAHRPVLPWLEVVREFTFFAERCSFWVASFPKAVKMGLHSQVNFAFAMLIDIL